MEDDDDDDSTSKTTIRGGSGLRRRNSDFGCLAWVDDSTFWPRLLLLVAVGLVAVGLVVVTVSREIVRGRCVEPVSGR